MCAARLSFPKQYSGRTLSFGSTPEKLDAWLIELKTHEVEISARKLHETLVELNRTEINTGFRMRVMLRIVEILNPLVVELEKKYIHNSTTIINKRTIEFTELDKHLLQECAFGFNKIINELANSNDKNINKERLALSIYLSITYLSQYLAIHYMTHEPVVGDIWGELNLLYRYANQLGIHQLSLGKNGSSNETIENVFTIIILLSVVNPYRLLQSDIYHALNILKQWSNLCHLENKEIGWKPQGDVVVDLSSEKPPMYAQPDESYTDINSIRVINVDGLATTLGKVQNTGSLENELANRLVKGKHSNIYRNSNRRSSFTEMELAFGLNPCHTLFIQEQDEINEDDSELGDDLHDELNRIYTQQPHNDDHALWNSIYLSAQLSHEDEYSKIECQSVKQIDVSMGGYGLKHESAKDIDVKIGEIACVRISSIYSTPWRVGDVRWIKNEGNESVIFGIRLLAEDAKPFFALPSDGNINENYLSRGLLIPSYGFENPAASLILMPNTFKPTDKLRILTDNMNIKVELTEILEGSDFFARFAYEIIKN
jgi:hypothetical protein